jgi:hypothetical protein
LKAADRRSEITFEPIAEHERAEALGADQDGTARLLGLERGAVALVEAAFDEYICGRTEQLEPPSTCEPDIRVCLVELARQVSTLLVGARYPAEIPIKGRRGQEHDAPQEPTITGFPAS